MTRRRSKPKPMSPEEIAMRAAQRRAEEKIAMRNPENWGADGKALARQPDVRIVPGARGKVQTARRDDVFDRFLARGALSQHAHQAVRRLDADMTERRGEGERGSGEKVDGSGACDLVTQRMIDAGDRVDEALRLVGRRDALLLHELLEPRQVLATNGLERWRMVVVVMTGESGKDAQPAVIRSACENLVHAYREIDARPRPRPAGAANAHAIAA